MVLGKVRKKNKNSHAITVQPTAVSRRKYKHRGRGAASYGRRVKDTALKSKMVVTDEDETILHSLFPNKNIDQTNLFIH